MSARRRTGGAVDGVLLLDKPHGMTSNRALQRVKRLYEAERAGHTGTLDPLATGLLPIALGEATKFCQVLLDADKTYRAELRLGITTTTADAEGELVTSRDVDVRADQIEPALALWRGEISQIPPMYSALKVAGRALYDYARRGESLERASRTVRVHELRCVAFEPPLLKIEVRCSKGTYVRTLAEDIGATLGCGAHLAALRRTAIAQFSLIDALTLHTLEEMLMEDRLQQLRPIDHMLDVLTRIDLDRENARRFTLGQSRQISVARQAGSTRVYGEDARFLGIGDVSPEGVLQPRRLVRDRTVEQDSGP